MTEEEMTEEEMFKEMDEFRAQGHVISMTETPDGWVCTFDNVTARAARLILAWMAAKSHRQDSGPK
jgi:hypothetical protein